MRRVAVAEARFVTRLVRASLRGGADVGLHLDGARPAEHFPWSLPVTRVKAAGRAITSAPRSASAWKR